MYILNLYISTVIIIYYYEEKTSVMISNIQYWYYYHDWYIDILWHGDIWFVAAKMICDMIWYAIYDMGYMIFTELWICWINIIFRDCWGTDCQILWQKQLENKNAGRDSFTSHYQPIDLKIMDFWKDYYWMLWNMRNRHLKIHWKIEGWNYTYSSQNHLHLVNIHKKDYIVMIWWNLHGISKLPCINTMIWRKSWKYGL